MLVCRECGGTLTFGREPTDCHDFTHHGTKHGEED